MRSNAVRDRVHALTIPPAWHDVWIAPTSACHIQVTGRDAAGRKQYIYHEKWRVSRDEQKYARLVALGRLLPRIRRRVDRDLKGSVDLSHARVMASLVRLLESSLIRIGNDEYARSNQSFGLTTIRKKHVAHLGRRSVVFDFTGKSAKQWRGASSRITAQASLLTPEQRSVWAASACTPVFERAVLAYVERRWRSRRE